MSKCYKCGGNNFHTEYCDYGIEAQYQSASPEIARLRSALEAAEKGLEHYADEKNWKSPKGSMALILWRPNQSFASTNLGYILARETLAEVQRLKEGKTQ